MMTRKKKSEGVKIETDRPERQACVDSDEDDEREEAASEWRALLLFRASLALRGAETPAEITRVRLMVRGKTMDWEI